MCTTVNKNTIKGQNFINAYNTSSAASLADVYGRPSTAKTRAEHFCRVLMNDENGEDFRIISANTFAFSAAWRTAAGLRVETVAHSYIIK